MRRVAERARGGGGVVFVVCADAATRSDAAWRPVQAPLTCRIHQHMAWLRPPPVAAPHTFMCLKGKGCVRACA